WRGRPGCSVASNKLVKHIKARVDVIRGKVFSKCAHEIAIAARDGGGDASMNPRLRAAIDHAKSVSMPKDKIERAVKKGTGELGGEALQEVTYEGYGPEGVAFIVETTTDNLNRTAADMREIFSKNGGNVATQGSVTYQFDRKGEIRLPAGEEELVMEAAILAGADDVISEEDGFVVLTPPTDLAAVVDGLREKGFKPLSEKLVSIPQSLTEIDCADKARALMKLYDLLDEYQDTLNVFTNFEVSDRVLAEI
ncbi:MAG: YebC/PmpR family DNA-binding transcriptional regulator, partial [Verrucomicrobiales bacterium]